MGNNLLVGIVLEKCHCFCAAVMGEVKCCYFPVIKQFSLLLALRFFCLEVSVMALFCSLTFVIFIQNCGIWLQKQKEEGLICVGNLTVAKYVKLVYIWSQNDRVFWHWKTYGSSFERCKNSCNILLSMAVVFFVFFVYKFQFRGLQPFRVKHDDHRLLIFVVCKRCSTENFLLDVS